MRAVDAGRPTLLFVEEVLCRAIRVRRVVRFAYEGAVRTAEPHIVGRDHRGRRLLSAWQLSGGSGEAFRSYGLDKLSQLQITLITFRGRRPDYNPEHDIFAQLTCRL